MALGITLASLTWNTTGGDKTLVATPALSDIFVVIAATSGLSGGTTSVSDDNADGRGTYVQVDQDRTGFSTTGVLTVWVRNERFRSATSTTVTASQTGSSGGGLGVFFVTGASIAGLNLVRRIGVASWNTGGQSSGTAGTTPAPVLAATPLTGNAIITAVCNGTNSATTVVQRAGYIEDADQGYNTPATGIEISHFSSGETSATITYGGTTVSAFASVAIELDASVPLLGYVNPAGGKGSPGMVPGVGAKNVVQQGAVGRKATW